MGQPKPTLRQVDAWPERLRTANVSPSPDANGAAAMPADGVQPPEGAIIPELGVSWKEIKKRLNDELRYNPLDMENPPNPLEPKADTPAPMVWTDGFGKDEGNPEGKNSTSLLNSIKKWEMELPNM